MMQSPLAVARERFASAAQASYQNAGVVSTDSTVFRPVKTKKKRSEIIGLQLLSVQCNGRNYIRLGRLLDVDLCAFTGWALRDFYDGYGERVSYVIIVSPFIIRLPSCMAQRLGFASSVTTSAIVNKRAALRKRRAKPP